MICTSNISLGYDALDIMKIILWLFLFHLDNYHLDNAIKIFFCDKGG